MYIYIKKRVWILSKEMNRDMKSIKDSEQIKEMAQPLIDYLREKFHPHTRIIISDDRILITEDKLSLPIEVLD